MNGTQAVAVGLGVLAVVALGLAAPMVESATEGAAGTGFDGEVQDRNETTTPVQGEESRANKPDDAERIDWENESKGNGSIGEGEGSDAGGGGGSLSVTDSPLVALAALAVVAAAAVALAVRTGDGDAPDPRESDEEEEGTDPATLSEVGSAAGRAADRMAEADPENAVYSAWVDMTRLLDVPDPDATTPGEFAAAAVDAGMDPEDVHRLTDAFEAVRYGDGEVTAARERETREAFRRIEAAYADGGGGDGTAAPDVDGEGGTVGGGDGSDNADGGDPS